MGQKKQTETGKKSLSSLYDRLLLTLEKEISGLPETLQLVTPEKKLDFISKTLPLLLRYRESGEGDPDKWGVKWGD